MGINKVGIIFLDIDGVLNSYKDRSFNYDCVNRFNTIIEKTNADIVLSSSWRHFIPKGMFSLKGLHFLLQSHGVNGNLIDTTEHDTSEVSKRVDQIRNYIEKHKVDRYVILDDYFIDLNNFVKVNGNFGLQNCDVELAIKFLKGKI